MTLIPDSVTLINRLKQNSSRTLQNHIAQTISNDINFRNTKILRRQHWLQEEWSKYLP